MAYLYVSVICQESISEKEIRALWYTCSLFQSFNEIEHILIHGSCTMPHNVIREKTEIEQDLWDVKFDWRLFLIQAIDGIKLKSHLSQY